MMIINSSSSSIMIIDCIIWLSLFMFICFILGRAKIRRRQTCHFRERATLCVCNTNIYIYIYIYIHLCIVVYMLNVVLSLSLSLSLSLYIYIYIYMRLRSSEGRFTRSREIEPVRRSLCRRRSCTLTEVAFEGLKRCSCCVCSFG